jgi:hypothetical protein
MAIRTKHQITENTWFIAFMQRTFTALISCIKRSTIIHHAPVNGKLNLCTEFIDYEHSSAAYYERPHPFIVIADYRDYWF